jgi:hypothetical protein
MISFSEFLAYLKCPALYKKIYIENLKIETDYFEKGKTLHEFQKYFWDNFDNFYDYKNNKLICAIPNEFSNIKSLAKKLIDFEKKRIDYLILNNKANYIKPIYIEKEIVCDDLQIKGVIDRIELNELDEPGIIELKTKSIKTEHILQGYFYKILCDNANLFDKQISWFVVFTPYKDVFYLKLNNKQFEKQMIDLIKFVQESIKKKIFVKQKMFKLNYNGTEINLNCDFPNFMHSCYGGE